MDKTLVSTIFVGAVGAILLMLVLTIVSVAVDPDTQYKIQANGKTYYTDNYSQEQGFITINGYSEQLSMLPIFLKTDIQTTLQGDIKIIKVNKK